MPCMHLLVNSKIKHINMEVDTESLLQLVQLYNCVFCLIFLLQESSMYLHVQNDVQNVLFSVL